MGMAGSASVLSPLTAKLNSRIMFGDLKSAAGVLALNEFLAEYSYYIEGYVPSQVDTALFEAFGAGMKSKQFAKASKNVAVYTTGDATASDDDDVDLFGSDDEDETEEKKRITEERLKSYAEKKSKKPALIAKTSVLFDVKPWDDETDMDEMLKSCKTIEMDGLLWGASKLVPIGYGIKKLQLMAVVEDAKVSIDELQEQMCEFEEFIQSVDVAAMNKI